MRQAPQRIDHGATRVTGEALVEQHRVGGLPAAAFTHVREQVVARADRRHLPPQGAPRRRAIAPAGVATASTAEKGCASSVRQVRG